MINIVYIDILLILNLYVSYFLIKGSSVFLHEHIKAWRCVLGASAGALSSLVILLPELPALLNLSIKLASGLVVVLIAFGFHSIYRYLKNALVFITVNVAFAGIMLALWYFASPLGMVYKNGYAYFDISFAAITISTIAAYGLIKAVRHILDVKFGLDRIYSITVNNEGKTASFAAFPDSGNTMTDFFTGLPVIICDREACREIIPEVADMLSGFDELDPDIIKGVRLLPYSTINGSGLMPVFRPESIVISSDTGRSDSKRVTAMIGISQKKLSQDDTNAVFNPKLLV